jgi:hypothetical protein
MDGRFLNAFIIPREWDIMGYKLKPFSLRFMIYLTALESPFMIGTKPPSLPEDILVFLRVCSSGDPAKAFQKPRLMDYYYTIRLSVDPLFYAKIAIQIKDYIELCCTSPKVYQKEDVVQSKTENIPMPLSFATSLMSRLHMSYEDAWNCTVGQAVWYLTAYGISEGAETKILSTEVEDKAESDLNKLKAYQEAEEKRIREEWLTNRQKQDG